MTERPVLLVTGGSRGIGAALCRLAAARGFDIALNYRSEAAAAESVAGACRAAGARVEILQGDMAVDADIDRVVGETMSRFGRIDHLANNAGITGRASRLDAADPAGIRAVIDLNVTGAILVARAVVPHMSTRHGKAGGTIVNLSSAAVWKGAPGDFIWYSASKAAIDTFTLGLAMELGGEGIRVNAVAPGLIETDIHETAGLGGRIGVLSASIPLSRGGTAEEVAEVMLFLMSDAASYVTGAVYRVTGGR